MRVTSQTTVAAPIDTVWDSLSNHSGISRWAPGLTVTMDRLGTADAVGEPGAELGEAEEQAAVTATMPTAMALMTVRRNMRILTCALCCLGSQCCYGRGPGPRSPDSTGAAGRGPGEPPGRPRGPAIRRP